MNAIYSVNTIHEKYLEIARLANMKTVRELREFHVKLREYPMDMRMGIYMGIVYWRRLAQSRYRELKLACGRARRAADIVRKTGREMTRTFPWRSFAPIIFILCVHFAAMASTQMN